MVEKASAVASAGAARRVSPSTRSNTGGHRRSQPARTPIGWLTDPRVQVLLFLLAAAILDHITGPDISAAAFYIFPVWLAGWRLGGRAAALTAGAAILLNAATFEWEMGHRLPDSTIIASQALHSIVYTAVAYLSTRLRNERRLLQAQSQRVEKLNRQMASEMQAARTLQKILSVPPPTHPAVEIWTFAATARILGGDVLDVSVSTKGDRLAIVIADVSGKGSPAALTTAILLGILEDCPARFDSPSLSLQFLNERLESRLPTEMFVTALYLVLDLETGWITWASAGHERPLLVRKLPEEGNRPIVEELTGDASHDPSGDPALAVVADTVYTEHSLLLSPGDTLFCYTDGLPDMRLPDGRRLGMERLGALVAECSCLPCDGLISALFHRATGQDKESFCAAGLDDDITILALRKRPL